MGKKKRKRRQQKLARRVDKWTAKEGWDHDDVVFAGLGTLAAATRAGKKKHFEKAVSRGRKLAKLGVSILDDRASSVTDLPEPVISYSPKGGGWYTIEVDGVEVGRVQGEEAAAGRAGELLDRYAALDATDRKDPGTAVRHTGGGWYEVVVSGVPVDRVRGKDEVSDRYGHLFPESA